MENVMKKTGQILLLLMIVLLFAVHPVEVRGQESDLDIEELKKVAPKVYIDCGLCDIDYIRTEITFVNYVRDRKEAQIHLLVTTQSTGSGGKEYTIAFIGQGVFEGVNDTQTFITDRTDTSDEIRVGLVMVLKIGLMSYVAKTPISERIKIDYTEPRTEDIQVDRWNSWIFRISGSGSFKGEESYRSNSLDGTFSAARITSDFKTSMSLRAELEREDYHYDGGDIKSTSESFSFNGLFVKSLSEHWSVGAFVRADSSSYENVKFAVSPQPAVEYNLFPYSQSTRRQLCFLYRIGFNAVRYREETIYNKTGENLLQEALSITLSLKEKWGTVSTSLSGSHYFHDFSKNRINFFGIVSLQLLKGLNLFAIGGGSRIHDQLALPKGGATLEEVLLRRKLIETGYNYFVSVGFSYSFGSIFTNVVNPRFGSSGYGGMNIIID